jgi:hypothetical protein
MGRWIKRNVTFKNTIMVLTVEHKIGTDHKLDEAEVEIYCDPEGLDVLLRKLTLLKARGGHTHLMSSSWAGSELTEQKQGESTTLINHLCVILISK